MKNKTLQIIEFIWIVALPLGVMILILVGDKSPLALKMLADIELFLKIEPDFVYKLLDEKGKTLKDFNF